MQWRFQPLTAIPPHKIRSLISLFHLCRHQPRLTSKHSGFASWTGALVKMDLTPVPNLVRSSASFSFFLLSFLFCTDSFTNKTDSSNKFFFSNILSLRHHILAATSIPPRRPARPQPCPLAVSEKGNPAAPEQTVPSPIYCILYQYTGANFINLGYCKEFPSRQRQPLLSD